MSGVVAYPASQTTGRSPVGSPHILDQSNSNLAPTTVVNDADYDSYVEVMLADAAGFCQLSTEFFVAQGWNSRTATATVCSSFLLFSIVQATYNTLVRILGITFNGRKLATHMPLHVYALIKILTVFTVASCWTMAASGFLKKASIINVGTTWNG
jgi:hypothetical protein